MVELILKFAQCCRAGDLKVATSEVLDAIHQLELVSVIDEAQFKAVLGTNFAKSRREQNLFNYLYDLYFHKLQTTIGPTESDQSKALFDAVGRQLNTIEKEDPKTKAILDFLAGDTPALLEAMLRLQNKEDEKNTVVKSNLSSLSGRLEVMLQLNNIRSKVNRFLDQTRIEADDATRNKIREFYSGRLDTAYKMLMAEPKPKNDGLKEVKAHDKHFQNLGEKFFSSLTPIEVDQMRDVVEHLIRRLRDMAGRRYKARSRGVLDVKKTLRRASGYQGVPLEIQYRKKAPHKAKVVTLCDISGSVWSAARFMLNMLYAMQDCFSKVRSFVFVADLAEVTRIFEKNEINQAIEKAMTDASIEYQALTDYGAMLQQFKRNYMGVLNHRTTLIIVGDGRSNYFNPQEKILDEMRLKCRRIIWLNPEPERFWASGDSEMNTYKSYCHEVRPCQNLNQLIDFIQELVL